MTDSNRPVCDCPEPCGCYAEGYAAGKDKAFFEMEVALPPDFFQPPFGRTEQLELLIHEFGHALAQKGIEHGPRWGYGTAKAGALIAAHGPTKPQQPASN